MLMMKPQTTVDKMVDCCLRLHLSRKINFTGHADMADISHRVDLAMLTVWLTLSINKTSRNPPLTRKWPVALTLTENCVIRVHRHLVFGGVPDEPLRVRERDIRGCCPVTLVIGDNLGLSVLKNADTRIRRAKINTNRWCFRHCAVKETFPVSTCSTGTKSGIFWLQTSNFKQKRCAYVYTHLLGCFRSFNYGGNG